MPCAVSPPARDLLPMVLIPLGERLDSLKITLREINEACSCCNSIKHTQFCFAIKNSGYQTRETSERCYGYHGVSHHKDRTKTVGHKYESPRSFPGLGRRFPHSDAFTAHSPPSAPSITSANTVTSSWPPVYISPMAKPAPYSGSEEDCNGFLLQCSLTLEMQQHLFPMEVLQLSGKALQWADSIWSQNNPVIQTYSGFVNHFKEVFGKHLWDSSIGEKLCWKWME
ncbi:hypothetical protein DPX16_21308 [Anabarilius grahami]|uniref:Uncharacterized protein n=1 Tax=Anabarilius grahami TaxID=495550 RepID=A0A3N0XZW2_ANAGA|nr:hypothetical protein DPX16_21308 [Anabarilius grahami]